MQSGPWMSVPTPVTNPWDAAYQLIRQLERRLDQIQSSSGFIGNIGDNGRTYISEMPDRRIELLEERVRVLETNWKNAFPDGPSRPSNNGFLECGTTLRKSNVKEPIAYGQ